MCGRFVSAIPSSGLETLFGAESCEQYLSPSYNVAPSMEIYGVVGDLGSVNRNIEVFRWGFGLRSEKKGGSSTLLINARIETVDSKPRFASSFESRRCLVPAGGFYEWPRGRGSRGRQPSYIYKPDKTPIAMAGIWEPGSKNSGLEYRPSLVILTRESDRFMSAIHDRMPVTLPSSLWSAWLDPSFTNPGELKRAITEAPTETLEAHFVDGKVGNPERDEPGNITAVQSNTLW